LARRKSDPFVVLKRNHADEERTKVVKANLNPQWDEHFTFTDCTAADLLTFEVFDKVSRRVIVVE
jgi:Ca2+-dependent lipid-binding protein